jgi:hypothetical protein
MPKLPNPASLHPGDRRKVQKILESKASANVNDMVLESNIHIERLEDRKQEVLDLRFKVEVQLEKLKEQLVNLLTEEKRLQEESLSSRTKRYRAQRAWKERNWKDILALEILDREEVDFLRKVN